jgi:hypothetical protein
MGSQQVRLPLGACLKNHLGLSLRVAAFKSNRDCHPLDYCFRQKKRGPRLAGISRHQKNAELGGKADGTMSQDWGLGLHVSSFGSSTMFVVN